MKNFLFPLAPTMVYAGDTKLSKITF